MGLLLTFLAVACDGALARKQGEQRQPGLAVVHSAGELQAALAGTAEHVHIVSHIDVIEVLDSQDIELPSSSSREDYSDAFSEITDGSVGAWALPAAVHSHENVTEAGGGLRSITVRTAISGLCSGSKLWGLHLQCAVATGCTHWQATCRDGVLPD